MCWLRLALNRHGPGAPQYRSIPNAAFRPSGTACTIRLAPREASPPAKTPGTLIIYCSSALLMPQSFTAARDKSLPAGNGTRSKPQAMMTKSAGTVNSEPGTVLGFCLA